MDYRSYDIEDFVSDPAFRKWVLNPDEDSNFFWGRWIIENLEKKAIIEKAAVMVQAVSFEETSFEGDEKENLLKKIEQTIQDAHAVYKPSAVYSMHAYSSKKKNLIPVIFRFAAVFTGAILIASFLLTYFNEKSLGEVETAETKLIVRELSKGQKMKIFLPDGSVVYLNSSSKITYPVKFTGDTREVELIGEAFFEVATDTLNPFIVTSDGVIAKVYGTSFNVSSYPESGIISVSLVSGKVVVSKGYSSESVMLNPGESVDWNKRTGEMAKELFDYKKVVLWKDGIIYFKEASIEEVFKRLEQWYGVAFHAEKIPSGLKPINGSFDNEYLKNVLLSLAHAVNFDFQIKDNEVYVKF
jgi:transmembrane sensor